MISRISMLKISSVQGGVRNRFLHSPTNQPIAPVHRPSLAEAVRNQQKQQQQQPLPSPQQQQQQQSRETQRTVKDMKTMKDDEDPMAFQKSLGARAEQINRALLELQPKLAALKDPVARKEVELHVRDLARRGRIISEAKRKLDAILLERGRAS